MICLRRDQGHPKYLVEGRYTSDGLAGLVREGASRRRRDIAKTIESAGGKLEVLYFAFGDADLYIICDVPGNISAAALSVVANQSGFVTSKIIVLMTADEMDQAFKKAMTIEFLPPGECRVFELILKLGPRKFRTVPARRFLPP